MSSTRSVLKQAGYDLAPVPTPHLGCLSMLPCWLGGAIMSRFDSPVSVPALGESDGGDCVVCFLNLGFSVGGQLGLGRAAVETRADVGMMEGVESRRDDWMLVEQLGLRGGEGGGGSLSG